MAALAAGCPSIRLAAVHRSTPAASCGVVATPSPTRRAPDLRAVTSRRIDLWEHRLRANPALRQATEDGIARGAPYLPHLCAILAQHGLPPELALLPVVESGFWSNARGRSGERGLWQLRRATARRFGLVVNRHRDDRLDPDRATRAAARYLAFLHRRYREWPLALAAYNAGERRVDRARAHARGATFWQLADRKLLPRTSREYVPHFFAVVRVTEAGRSSQLACGTIGITRRVARRGKASILLAGPGTGG